MKLKIGDLVRFVDEAIEGHITSFQRDDIIGVTDDSGFEIPVPADKVTLVHGDMNRPDDDDRDIPASSGPFVDKGIYLAVVGDQKDGLARFMIVNESSYRLSLSTAEIVGHKAKGIQIDILDPKTYTEIYKANFSGVGKWPIFSIQILRHTDETMPLTQPISKEIRVRAFDLNNPKQKSNILAEKAWLFELDNKTEDIGLEKLKSFGY